MSEMKPDAEAPPTTTGTHWADLFGADPDWCGGLSVDEFMEQMRGDA